MASDDVSQVQRAASPDDAALAAARADSRVTERRLNGRQADRMLAISEALLRDPAVQQATQPGALDTIASLVHAATHDTLTGLPTRGLLLDRLERALAAPRVGDAMVAALFVDLDNFKLVNDSLGHDSGDVVLREMARRIGACVAPGDTLSRFGGDELVILHPAAEGGSESTLAARILATMVEPITVAGREVVVSASVGIALSAPGVQSAEQLLRDADTALYAAKSRGRNRAVRFNEELHARVARRVQIESDLRVALRDNQLSVQYQPQVDLRTGRVVGVEALCRWHHPEHGPVSPAEFIPVAEECRLIGALGRQVLQTACRQLAEWTRALPASSKQRALTMTVNLSPRQLDDPSFVTELELMLAQTGIAPDSLCLELTESALTTNRETDTVEVLQRVRALGVYVAIDDFGTEHSSLARLRSLPVEVLKIDRRFIDGLSTEPGDTAIVSSILSLAFAMGKHVIAEGVERPEQAVALRSMGCGVAQGYLFSKPVDAALIPGLLGAKLRHPTTTWSMPAAVVHAGGHARRGYRSFIDEFLDHIGAPMGARAAGST